jgi:predicted nucleotidyltransferase
MDVFQGEPSKSAKTADRFIDQLLFEISSDKMPQVVLLAKLGSWVRAERTENSDYDLLLVCSDTPAYLRSVQVIAEVQQRLLLETGVVIAAFPSFRIEELHRALVKKPCCLVHLLIYPSLNDFLSWERSDVLRSICASAQVVVGDNELVTSIANNLPSIGEKVLIEDLSSLLYNSFVYLVSGQLAEEDLSIREGFHKLQYCVRHLTALSLQKIGIHAYSWESVAQEHSKLGFPSFSVVDSIFGIRMLSKVTCGKLSISKEALMELYEKAFSFLSDIRTHDVKE